jgi:hypothetical protein
LISFCGGCDFCFGATGGRQPLLRNSVNNLQSLARSGRRDTCFSRGARLPARRKGPRWARAQRSEPGKQCRIRGRRWRRRRVQRRCLLCFQSCARHVPTLTMIDGINAVVPMAARFRSFDACTSRQNRTIPTERGQNSEQIRRGDPNERDIISHRVHLHMSTAQRARVDRSFVHRTFAFVLAIGAVVGCKSGRSRYCCLNDEGQTVCGQGLPDPLSSY